VSGVAVFNVAGTLYSTQNECTHARGPLCEGKLEGSTVTCPWHGSRFDVSTGSVLSGPAVGPLQTYRVTVKGGIGRVEPE
jgi:nitrite reductase/ring-hydroxylating ferredoxin subunit